MGVGELNEVAIIDWLGDVDKVGDGEEMRLEKGLRETLEVGDGDRYMLGFGGGLFAIE